MIKLKELNILESKAELDNLPEGKLLINTINAHSYNTARKDKLFAEALMRGDVLIPDGISIVKACRWLKAKSQPKDRIAGWDLFEWEMRNLSPALPTGEGALKSPSTDVGKSTIDETNLKAPSLEGRAGERSVMFLGSSEKVLSLIRERAKTDYPHLKIITYSPPYKPVFSDEDNATMIKTVNDANPDLLWIGMTAPKQEKWAWEHWEELDIHCHCGTIGAVFDFYAGTMQRAPEWWQKHGLEWLYRLLKEPKRMWRRYIIGNALFLWNIAIKE